MKKYITNYLLLGLLAVLPTLFFSCSDDEGVFVTRVCTQKVNDTETVLTKVRLGEKIRIEGSGFTGIRAIYCNGVEVTGINSNYITDDNIIITIPKTIPTGTEVTDETVRNTIRIVTKNDDFIFPFTIMAAAPAITNISHTMPRVGEWIEIYGTDLKDIEKVTFPGGVVSTDIKVNGSYTVLSVRVPEGVEYNSGRLTVEGANGGAYSYNNFNFKPGLFIVKFGEDPADKKAYNYGRVSISDNTTAVMPSEVDGPKSPDVYRSIPKEPAEIPTTEKEIGGFNFFPYKAIQIVLDACAESRVITEDTPCSELAFQCDYYVNVPWQAGALRMELDGKRCTPLPWVNNGSVVPVDFVQGWKTMTWPITEITDFATLTLGALRDRLNNKNGSIYWKCGNFQDKSGNWFSGNPMENAQMSFGNFRIVPYVKASYKND